MEHLPADARLRRTQDELAAACGRLAQLFDDAPVGYLTVDAGGRVIEANLTAAALCGVERARLLGLPFEDQVAPADHERWRRLLDSALGHDPVPRSELLLHGAGHTPLPCQLDTLPATRGDGEPCVRLTLTDISARRLAETRQRMASRAHDAREAERRRLAHTLHEDLGQRLIALKMQLGGLRAKAVPARGAAEVRAMTASIDQALALVRRMSSDLHPPLLELLGLHAALDSLVDDTATRLRRPFTLRVDDAALQRCGAGTVALYRLVETALALGALRTHGPVRLELVQQAGDLVLALHGEPGIDPDAEAARASTELTDALRDQVHLLGGWLEIGGPDAGAPRLAIGLPGAPGPAA